MSHPPIPISELAEHTEVLKANDNLKLSQEYEVSEPKVKVFLLSIDFCLIVFSLEREYFFSSREMAVLLFFPACPQCCNNELSVVVSHLFPQIHWQP